ncbi:MAG: thioredoxin-disulfide reductase [Pseudomonadota bacterium]
MPSRNSLVIIGSGPAGYTAAIYAARAGLSPQLIHGMQPGGQLMITTDVENYPGYADVIQGPWLMEQMRAQAGNVGAQLIEDHIREVDFSSRPFTVQGEARYQADAVIICTGAQARWLGLESETRLHGRGVSACATCDGFFFRNQDVVVVGGGNTAAEEALYLANLCKSVTLVHRRDQLRADHTLTERVKAHEKITICWNHVVQDILGEDGVQGVRLAHSQEGTTQDLAVTGVFIAIGHDPATALFRDQLTLDDNGYILTEPGSTKTNIPGVFAAGDVTDHVYRQAVTAAGLGCMAALDAERFLSVS